MKVVVVDGGPGGWAAMCWDVTEGALQPTIHSSLATLVASYPDAEATEVINLR